jgi:hypothetical protein
MVGAQIGHAATALGGSLVAVLDTRRLRAGRPLDEGGKPG